jgi:predicted nucleotidyltransferase
MLDHGLVSAIDVPPATLYAANRDHLAWPAIDQLAQLRATLIGRIRSAAAAWQPSSRVVALFGSAARADGGSGSAIGLFVVANASTRDAIEDALDAIRHDLTRWTGNAAHSTVFTPADIKRLAAAHDPVLANARRDAIIVGGDRKAIA